MNVVMLVNFFRWSEAMRKSAMEQYTHRVPKKCIYDPQEVDKSDKQCYRFMQGAEDVDKGTPRVSE